MGNVLSNFTINISDRTILYGDSLFVITNWCYVKIWNLL